MDAVLAAAQTRARALVTRDWDSVSAQLHRRFRYVTANAQRLDRDAYLAFLADGPVRWNRQTLHDAEVVVEDRVAVLVATVVDDVLYAGRPAQWEFVTSQTYVERSGEWLYLAGHTALPAA